MNHCMNHIEAGVASLKTVKMGVFGYSPCPQLTGDMFLGDQIHCLVEDVLWRCLFIVSFGQAYISRC